MKPKWSNPFATMEFNLYKNPRTKQIKIVIISQFTCFSLQSGGTGENISLSGIGMVSEGKGQVWGKDDPMQLSDIIPKKSMYDKMRPPKVEGKILDF